jgi:UDP-glucose 4-epimerase
MRVLITGGAGFIGSTLADRLLARRDTVTVIDNYATGRRDNLTAQPNLHVVEGSIADADALAEAFRVAEPECVVHAAAAYKDPANWLEDIRTNAEGTAAVAKASQTADVRRLIYFQTALCYGLHPLEQPITLSHPLHPEGSSYAISKTTGEHYIALSGLDFISFRLANAYGPRNLSGPLPTFYHRLTGGKTCFVMDTRRDFVFIDDLVDVVIRAVDGAGSRGYYHVSSGRDHAIRELYDEAVAALGLTGLGPIDERPRNPDDAFSILLDPSKTNEDFGWRTQTPLSQGVRLAIEYYRRYGIQETYTHLKAMGDE